jgi:hypothetical protein
MRCEKKQADEKLNCSGVVCMAYPVIWEWDAREMQAEHQNASGLLGTSLKVITV